MNNGRIFPVLCSHVSFAPRLRSSQDKSCNHSKAKIAYDKNRGEGNKVLQRHFVMHWLRYFWLTLRGQAVSSLLLCFGLIFSLYKLLVKLALLLIDAKSEKWRLVTEDLAAAIAHQGDGSSNIIAAFQVTGKLEFDKIVANFHERVLPYTTSYGSATKTKGQTYKPFDILRWSITQRYLLYFYTRCENFKSQDHFILEGEEPLDKHLEEATRKLCQFYCGHIFDPKKPQWRVSVIPSKNTYAIVFAFHHSYMDAPSFLQMIRFAWADTPFDMNIDPMKYPGNRPAPTNRLEYLKSFLQALRVSPNPFSFAAEENHPLNVIADRESIQSAQDRGPASRHCLWSQEGLDLKLFKNSVKPQVSTTSFIVSCWTRAMQNVFKAAKLPLPESYTTGILFANYPYKSLELQNNVFCSVVPIPCHVTGEQLEEECRKAIHAYSGHYFVSKLQREGIKFRSRLIEPFLGIAAKSKYVPWSSVMISNIVGPKESFTICGGEVTKMVVFPPLKLRNSIVLGMISYRGRVYPSVQVDETTVQRVPEALQILQYFQNQVVKCSDDSKRK